MSAKNNKDKANDYDALTALEAVLIKARKRLSDETEDPMERDDENPDFSEDQGFREFDPDTEGDDADKWLEANDPEKSRDEDEEEDEDGEPEEYDEYSPDEDEEAHQRMLGVDERPLDEGEESEEQPSSEDEGAEEEGRGAAEAEGGPAEVTDEEPAEQEVAPSQPQLKPEASGSRFPQPTREEIAEMRQYTRPWEQRAREKTRLEAEAHKNPVLHHEGKLVEARNAAHRNYQDSYKAFQESPEYQNADPITQMQMDTDFESKWHKENPEYLSNAANLHHEAHKKGLDAKDVHAAAKDEQIKHVLSGGAQPETAMSTEEAMQHAGGTKDEEGTTGSMTQDPSSSFASGNKAFLDQYAKEYAKKKKKPRNLSDMENYDEGSKADVQRVLGEHPALKDPSKKAKVDAFFQKYHPLIAMNARKVLNKLGLDEKRGDIDLGMLHEAGMHGLMQSINDYNHDHPSKASFATHAGNKIRGLQQTALRNQDQIPQELRVGAKKFQQQSAGQVTKPDIKGLVAKHPPEVADRLKRIDSFKAVSTPKVPKPDGGENNEQ